MNAKIIEKDKQGIGVRVTDNEGVKHTVAIGFDGEVQGHSQDGYPDEPQFRSPSEHEAIHQAEYYAKYQISAEMEYGPFEPFARIERLEMVRDAIAALTDEEFVEHFSDVWRQVIGKHPDIKPPVEMPPEVGPNDFVLFVIDAYLDDEGQLEAVSDIHLTYYDDQKNQIEQRNDDPFEDREPDATLQLVREFIPSLEVFKEYLDYHLRCQLRDCYHEMGLEPPAEYRVLGRGDHEIAKRYRNDDVTQYDYYHDEGAEIPGYELDFDYGFGSIGKAGIQALASEGPEDADVDIRALFDPDGDDGGLLDQVQEAMSGQQEDNEDTDDSAEKSESS